MKLKSLFCLLIAVVMLFGMLPFRSFATDRVSVDAEIMDVYGGAKGIISMTFDDGYASTAVTLNELMKKYDLKGSFNLCSGELYPDGADIPTCCKHVPLSRKAAIELFDDDRFEIVSHGYHHCAVGHIPPADAMYDMLTDRRELEAMFGRLVRGHVYPYGSISPAAIEIAKMCGFVYARRADNNPDFLLPESDEWMEWRPTGHFLDGHFDDSLDRFIKMENKYYHGKLFFAWAHSFDFLYEGGWEKLEEQFKKVAHRGDIWYATNIEVHDYVEAYRSLIFFADSTRVYNPTQIDVCIRYDGGEACVKAGETVTFR